MSPVLALTQLFQLAVVQYLVGCNADLKAEDQFKNNCLNDAVRHKYNLKFWFDDVLYDHSRFSSDQQARSCCKISLPERGKVSIAWQYWWCSYVQGMAICGGITSILQFYFFFITALSLRVAAGCPKGRFL
jgi:hypothetical protein